MTVNLEGFIALNMLMNMLALFSAARLCRLRIGLARSVWVSAAGVGYGICAYLPGFEALQGAPKLLFPFVMGAAAFLGSGVKAALRASLWICVSTFLLGGLGFGMMHVWGMNGYTAPLIIVTAVAGGVACFMLYFGVKQARAARQTVEVSVTMADMTVMARGIVDTGNALFEPLSGLPVVVLDIAAKPEGFSMPNTRPAPFTTVGGVGVAEAFLPDMLLIDGKPVRNAYAAFAPGLSATCAALVPPDALRAR